MPIPIGVLAQAGAGGGAAPNPKWLARYVNSSAVRVESHGSIGANSSGESFWYSKLPGDFLYIWKADSLGAITFQRRITLNNFSSNVQWADVDTNGNFYLVGNWWVTPNNNIFVMSIAANGTINWQKSISYSGAIGRGVKATPSSGVVYAVGEFQFGCLAMRFDSSGNTTWFRQLDGSNFEAFTEMDIDSSESLYAVGYVYVASPAGSTGMFAKYNSSGTLQFQKRIATSGIEIYSQSISTDSSGNSYVAYNAGSNNNWVARFNANGTINWQRTINQGGAASAFAIDASGNVYYYSYANNEIFYLIKFDSSGTVLWQRIIQGQAGFNGFGTARSISWRNGYIYLGGTVGMSYPDDGSFLGTFTAGTDTITVSASSLTIATASYTIGDHTLSGSSPSSSSSNSTATSTAGDITVTNFYY